MLETDQILTLLGIWDMNVGDYGIMDQILPKDAEIYRIFADYLGENGRQHVKQNFLVTRELRDYLLAFISLNSPGDVIYF